MNQQQLKAVFQIWADHLGSGQLDDFYAMMDEEIIIFDEDLPWRLTKKDFIEHIGFHVLNWDSFEWVPRELQYSCLNTVGIVSGYATFRGKPKDAGFRQRFMGFTQTWVDAGDGKIALVCWHQGPLMGQIEGASPS